MPLTSTLVASLLVASGAIAAPSNRVEDVKVIAREDRVDVVLKTRAAPTFQSFAKRTPAVVILDVIDASTAPKQLAAPKGTVIEELSLSAEQGNGNDVARLIVRFKQAIFYDVTATEHDVTLSIFGAPPAPDARFGAATKSDSGVRLASNTPADRISDAPRPRFAQAEGEGGAGMSTGSGGPRAMTYVGFRNLGSASEVFARMNGDATFEVKREGDNLLVLEIKNATIPLMNNKNHLDATFFDSPVKMITPTEVEDATPVIRIIIEMKEDVPYKTEKRGKEVTVVFQKGGGG